MLVKSMSEQESYNADADTDDGELIAVVGMACRFPGARNIGEYWNNLREGVESVKRFTDDELLAAGESASVLADPDYVKAQPVLEGFDRFDAKFWGFSPQDAAVTDPAHRLFLEVAYESLEHAGHTGYDAEGTVGVFATSGASQYWMNNLNSNPALIEEMGEFLVRHTGNDMNFLATRLSYELDLRGPSLNVQTACSSSLVAVHLAVQSLLGGECDTAIAGGATVLLPQGRGYLFKEGEIMSPDGHCRPFDANSAGTVFGSGAGSLVLRRLEDALDDGDTVYAIVRGSAINNDGARKVGYLAPGVEGQAGVLAEALELSGVKADEVSYIEAHGTGTLVGDPIEFEALNQVYKDATGNRHYCRVGSVKSNIGHLGEAAGVAAIIKVVQSLQHRQLPATLNYQSPNPDIELQDSPFVINDALTDWAGINGRRVAGVTALGAGGTNAHVIIDEPPPRSSGQVSSHARQLIVLSAKSETALRASSRNLANAMRAQDDVSLADIAYTLQVGRRAYSYRRVLVAKDKEEAIALLDDGESKRVVNTRCQSNNPSIVFMFPGGGAQYAGMGAELYRNQSVYRAAFDACLGYLDESLAAEIKALVFAEGDELELASVSLERPSMTLPSLFATEYALAKQFMFWGCQPVAFIGHSMGEYTAACLAGVISLEDAIELVLLRGQLFEKTPPGGMLSVSLPANEARTYMASDQDIAAINAPDLCVVSGSVASIEQLQKVLEEKEIDCIRVKIEVAAHSSMLDSILDEFGAFCQTITFSKPVMPFTSNLTGQWITDEEATDPQYWVKHLRNSVRFADNVETVLSGENRVLIEVGPGRTLTNLSKACATAAVDVFNTMRHASEVESDEAYALRSLGHSWAAGVETDWSIFWGEEQRRRVPLPTYPFERQAYWIDPGVIDRSTANQLSGRLEKRANMSDWFGRYHWTQTDLPVAAANAPASWLIFHDETGLGEKIVEGLSPSENLIHIRNGAVFKKISEDSYQLSADKLSHFEQLFDALSHANSRPDHIVYCWPVCLPREVATTLSQRLAAASDIGKTCFWGLFNLGKILSELDDPIRLSVVSSDMAAIGGPACIEKSVLTGPVLVMPRELPHVTAQSIDISLVSGSRKELENNARLVLKEVLSAGEDTLVAYRGIDRWVRKIEQAPIDAEMPDNDAEKRHEPWVRSKGTYLITGGLGGIGLTMAKSLAEKGAGKLILLGRKVFPEPSTWSQWLDEHADDDYTSDQIRTLQDIESFGAQVVLQSVDVADAVDTETVLTRLLADTAVIHGVIHAAGAMDDQLLLAKTPESVMTVMNAKISGTMILDALLSEQKLDFFVLFSSVASYLGLPGQIDYTAANAFLDAFAKDRAVRASGNTQVINWNAWANTGMAAAEQRLQAEGKYQNFERVKCSDFLFNYYTNIDLEHRIFSAEFDVESSWLLSEHQVINGRAVMPGTAYLEIIRAAFAQHCELGGAKTANSVCNIELTDVQFFSAFEVYDNKASLLNVDVDGNETGCIVTVYSESEDLPHAVANIRYSAAIEPAALNEPASLAALQDRCIQQSPTAENFLDQYFMNFGPRWGCINDIRYCEKEALIHIALPTGFESDFDNVHLHPSLLDMATGGAQFLIDNFVKERDFYVPVGYKKIQMFGDMPQHFVSYISLRDQVTADFVSFDVILMDERGVPFMAINEFQMRKTDGNFGVASNLAPVVTSLDDLLSQAILPEEGVEAFSRVMSLQESGQWIVSSVDTGVWQKQLNNPAGNAINKRAITYERVEEHNADADADIADIEACMIAHPAVESVIVRSFLDESGNRRLIAYFLPDDSEHVTVSELRKHVKSDLAQSSIPQHFIELDEMPTADDGRIVRKDLLDPYAPVDTYEPPRTPAEKMLAHIWQEALGVNRIGIADNFFDCGGHSLLAMRVILKISKKTGVRLDAAVIIMSTLEQIATELEQYMPDSTEDTKARPKAEQQQKSSAAAVEPNKNQSFIGKLMGRK